MNNSLAYFVQLKSASFLCEKSNKNKKAKVEKKEKEHVL